MPLTSAKGTVKLAHKLEKYENGRTPKDGAPDEVIEWTEYYEADGTLVTDEERKAEIDRAQEEQVDV